ncbi:De-etiolated protein 1 Det1 [Nesidiocoris tenuis]|uniref:De-etiolated protein 1 Det1 n=1 Tax=Nesidiocoris tenuis TaxID=355587 RepID=A0ABN7BDN8_9HEMI|nr:De-etiolated protein 1 Det1 [Nesidiocoris tenuis]
MVEALKRNKIPPQNIVQKLIRRETYGESRAGTSFYVTRSFYQNVVPDFTVINVEKPPCFLRKFSPDGRHFIAFSADQTSVEIYTFKGCTAMNEFLHLCKAKDFIGNKPEPFHDYLRMTAFHAFFNLKHSVNVTPMGEQLNRECSLFTEDGRYILVGSAAYLADDVRPTFYQVYTNNESVTPNPRSPLEDYSLHLIDMEEGVLCDTIQFKTDKIYVSHNQGLYLYENTLAVLSVQHQIIHIFYLVDGKFVCSRLIGPYTDDQDPYLLYRVYSSQVDSPAELDALARPYRDKIISGLKHRMLVYLFKKALESTMDRQIGKNGPTVTLNRVRAFFLRYEQIRTLRMWKMQLLDEDHLLIKYANEDVVTLKTTEPNAQPSFFVIYNIKTTRVLAVYENTSKNLLSLFEKYCDYFRNAKVPSGKQFLSSPSNSCYARVAQQRFKQTIISARFGGMIEARKRILAQLPISAQSFSSSPYLDLSLFSYDDKWVSAMERPKACGEHPIRFYSRESGLLKFRIHAGLMGRTVPPSARRLVAFIFHPSEPFAISVQRTNSDYVVNFHVRFPT